MTDEHRGLPHDLPEYVPNVPIRSKAKVFKGLNGRWYWGHWCREGSYRSGPVSVGNMIGVPLSGSDSWEQAFKNGFQHVGRCQ